MAAMAEAGADKTKGITLRQHVSYQQRVMRATGEFSAVISQVSMAAKLISRALSQAGLFNRDDCFEKRGEAAGEALSFAREMDDFASRTFARTFALSPWVSSFLSSEELESALLEERLQGGKYIVFVDALDGAPALDVNGSVGSIFSVYRRADSARKPVLKDLLQKGAEQVAAGYVLYGPSTMLVFAAAGSVNAYTLDPSIGEFLITREDIHIPERGLAYSLNEAKYHDWQEHLRRYIDYLRKRDPMSEKNYASRYAGSLIPDFHRILLEGGIYLCPGDMADPAKPAGKRLLMYECNPLAFIAEQAGGRGTTGKHSTLKIQPESLHQRCPLIVGSPYEVLLYEDFAQGRK